MKSILFEVYKEKSRLYTVNLSPGRRVYGENLVKEGKEYREWDPKRSKLAAYILKGAKNIGLRKDDVVLYLGAASGTTASHVSDIVGKGGFVFALDFAPRVVRELFYLCEERTNMAPLLADALKPMTYAHRVSGVDFIYQDIAQRDQVKIFLKNWRLFLKKGGFGMLALKSRSIDVAKNPKQIYKEVLQELEKEVTVADYRLLDPYEKDHAMFLCKKK